MKKTILLLIVILSLMAGAGCMTLETVNPAPSPQATLLPERRSGPDVQIVLPNFADVIAGVLASVVTISTDLNPQMNQSNPPEIRPGVGSGWVLDTSGLIVTNNHVIEGASDITVTLANQEACKARLVQADPKTDIAVVKIETEAELTPVKVGDPSRLKIGDWVIVMGNSLGMGVSAKQGTISQFGVTLATSEDQVYYNLIEISAAVNAGTSGGPLFNLAGEVIGICCITLTAAGIENMSYAININDVIPVIQTLAKGQRVIRPTLGLKTTTINPGLALAYQLPVNKGALVTGVTGGGPAETAGMKVGDIVTGFDNRVIESTPDLIKAVNSSPIGYRALLTYWRQGKQKTVTITLAQE